MLRNGDVTRWEAEVTVRRSEAPVALLLTRVPSTAAAEPMLLVQVTDVAAPRRAQKVAGCVASIRQVMVSAATVEQAVPQVLRELCEHLGWAAGRHWAIEADRASMRVRHAWSRPDPMPEAFLHASRGVALAEGAGVAGRAWRGGVATERDLEHAPGNEPAAAARGAELRAAV